MLAQNFKTAAELGISERLRRALATELGMLERGEISRLEFDMREWNCGTACCFGGWAEKIAGVPIGTFKLCTPDTLTGNRLMGIESLFAPHQWTRMTVSTSEATTALRNYLTTGDARWAEVLAEGPCPMEYADMQHVEAVLKMFDPNTGSV